MSETEKVDPAEQAIAERRFRILIMSGCAVVDILRKSTFGRGLRCETPLPEPHFYCSVHFDPIRDVWLTRVASPHFDPVPAGTIIPEHTSTVTTVNFEEIVQENIKLRSQLQEESDEK